MDAREAEQGQYLSNGCLVKQDGKVLQELAMNLKKPSNVCCRVEKFGNVVDGFCEVKRKWVAEMGFEGLLNLVGCRLPRSLCYWLATCVDCKKRDLVVDGARFPLSKVQVHWVYGLPHGPNAVPNEIKGKKMRKKEKDMRDFFSAFVGGCNKAVTGQAIIDALDSPAENQNHFKRAFLMFALNELICPTTCYRLSTKLIPVVLVYKRAKHYDWCSLLLDHLFFYLARFHKTFDSQGYVAGCGGCTHFLAVFYLDRLKRTPLFWGVNPRVKVWSNREVNKAIAEDRVTNGDFGRLGCIDLAYGEPHPDEARDLYPQGRTDNCSGIGDRVAHRFYTQRPPKYKRKKRKKATNDNPYERKLNKKLREAGEGAHDGKLVGNHLSTVERGPTTPVHQGLIANLFEEPGTEALSPFTIPRSQTHCNLRKSDVGPSHNSSPSKYASPKSGFVDRVVHGLIAEYCDEDGRDDAGHYIPPYAWGDCSNASLALEHLQCSGGSSSSAPQVSYTSYDESDYDDDSYIVVRLSPPPGFETPMNTTATPEANLESNEHVETNASGSVYETPKCGNKSVHRSRKQRVVRSSVKLSSQYIQIWRPSPYRGLKLKLAKLVLSSLSDPKYDPVVLDCGGFAASMSSAAAIVSLAGRVDIPLLPNEFGEGNVDLGDTATIRRSNTYTMWDCQVRRVTRTPMGNGVLVKLTSGWKKVVEDNAIKDDNNLYFEFHENSVFTMFVVGPNMMSKELEHLVGDVSKGHYRQVRDMKVLVMPGENSFAATLYMTRSNKEAFMVPINDDIVRDGFVEIPCSFVKKYLIHERVETTVPAVLEVQGQQTTVALKYIRRGQDTKGCIINSTFRDFVLRHNSSGQGVFVFELESPFDPIVMKVTIFQM